jgi:hypothetical protein
MVGDKWIVETPLAIAQELDRARRILTETKRAVATEAADAQLRSLSGGDVAALLKVAVGYPEASDAEVIDILEARLRRASNRITRGCGGCHAYCDGE